MEITTIEIQLIFSAQNSKYLRFIQFWFSYVDDIRFLWTGTVQKLQKIFEVVNNIHGNIKFTMKLQNHNSINLLDLNLQIVNSKISFGIYHRPTH